MARRDFVISWASDTVMLHRGDTRSGARWDGYVHLGVSWFKEGDGLVESPGSQVEFQVMGSGCDM